jgi:hypothetical protein
MKIKKAIRFTILIIILFILFLYFGGAEYVKRFGQKAEETGVKLEEYEKEIKGTTEKAKETYEGTKEKVKEYVED